jgi:hypothetical protein
MGSIIFRSHHDVFSDGRTAVTKQRFMIVVLFKVIVSFKIFGVQIYVFICKKQNLKHIFAFDLQKDCNTFAARKQ